MRQLLNETINIIEKTGRFIQAEQRTFSKDSIVAKGTHDYVSYVDKHAEQMLVNDLARLLPEAGFIAEEGTSNSRGVKYNWIIDPLDGTTNFIHGAPPYAVSVALMEGKKVVLGVVYELTLAECFSSATNLPVYRNDLEVKVSDVDTVEGSLIATGLPHAGREHSDTFNDTFMDLIKDLSQHSHGLRRPGSAATDLAYVACGRFDIFFQHNLQPWDVAAGAFLVNQAGGRCSSFSGEADYIFGKEIVATNGLLHKEFLAKVTGLHREPSDEEIVRE